MSGAAANGSYWLSGFEIKTFKKNQHRRAAEFLKTPLNLSEGLLPDVEMLNPQQHCFINDPNKATQSHFQHEESLRL